MKLAAVCGGSEKANEINVRRFVAAVCGGSEKANEINVRRFAADGVECTPIPPMRFAAPCWRAPRAHEAGRGNPGGWHGSHAGPGELHAETGAVAAVELDPIRAITRAGRLIDAALPMLA
jgi:hypothetical protein